MPHKLLETCKKSDRLFARAYLNHFGERNALLGFFFHGLYADDKKLHSGTVDPLEGTTIQRFREFVEYYLEHGYTFVSADDIVKGLSKNRRYVAATFDDGYANNQLALPILREYKIPATFFIVTASVQQNRAFWWDVLFRERARRGASAQDILYEGRSIKSLPQTGIEKYLVDLFGESAFEPVGDLDRPFTPSELSRFSREKYVCLGNHTRDHAILTNYAPAEVRYQILDAQKALGAMTGTVPMAIAYPNGRYTPSIVNTAREIGLKLGFTVVHSKNYMPLELGGEPSMRLSRFHLSASRPVADQCELFRSDTLIYPRLRSFLKRNQSE